MEEKGQFVFPQYLVPLGQVEELASRLPIRWTWHIISLMNLALPRYFYVQYAQHCCSGDHVLSIYLFFLYHLVCFHFLSNHHPPSLEASSHKHLCFIGAGLLNLRTGMDLSYTFTHFFFGLACGRNAHCACVRHLWSVGYLGTFGITWDTRVCIAFRACWWLFILERWLEGMELCFGLGTDSRLFLVFF